MKRAKFGRHQNAKTRTISSKCASGYVASRTFMLMDPKMEDDIHEYAKCTWKNKERHKLSEWKKLTRAALGVAMSKLDDLDDFGLFEKSLNDAIEARISTKHASNIVFGCTLFPKDLSTCQRRRKNLPLGRSKSRPLGVTVA